MESIKINLDQSITDFFSIFNTVITFLRSVKFQIGFIEFDLFTLAISLLVFEVVWHFVSALIWNSN